MKLTSLRIEQLRQFRQPFELVGLAPGLNLVHGPNESGKSTLVRAIRAAFFERYRSNSVDDLRPWGDSSAAPAVELCFDCMGRQWKLNKSFLQRKRCDLIVDGQAFDGETAEEKLAELLGFQFSGRGASKEEHWGIPGLLWVEQGTGHAIAPSVEFASEHLQTALNSLLGEIASSGGDDVIEAVERARGVLLTSTGRRRGEYGELGDQCDELSQSLTVLEQRIESYQSTVDRVGALRVVQAEAAKEQPWVEHRARKAEAEKKLVEIQTTQQEQQRDQRALQACLQTLNAYQDQQAQNEQQRLKLIARETAHVNAKERVTVLNGGEPTLKSAVAFAGENYVAAKKVTDSALRQEQCGRLQKQIAQYAEQIVTSERALAKISEYQGQLQAARDIIRDNRIDLDALEALRKNTSLLSETQIRSESVATRIGYQLLDGKHVTLNGELLVGSGERLLLDESSLELPGIGTLHVAPGGQAVADLRRRLERLEEAQATQMAYLGVESLPAAEARAARQAQGIAAQEKAQAQLDAIAPQGLDQLREQLDTTREAQAHAQSAFDALPALALTELTLDKAKADEELAALALADAEKAFTQHRQDMALAEQDAKTAHQEWDVLRTELQDEVRVTQLQQLEQSIAAVEADKRRLDDIIRDRQAAIEQARPDLLTQDAERFRVSAQASEKQHQLRAQQLAGLQGTLESLGAEGLQEQRDKVSAELAHARRRFEELHQRARALDLLLRLLQQKRQALTQRLQAPLHKHLDHYLRVLFPGASLEVDENLVPGQFSRGAEQGELAELSFGAREQLALISRLAYADLLKEAGRPTLIILDDTLVHSDRNRLDQMKRVLYDAAQRHQVLLFTCHPEHWQDLGVAPRDLVALKAGKS